MVSVRLHDILLHCVFNVTVHVRPVNTDSGTSLGFLNAHVPLVDTFQEVWSHRQRNDYAVV